MSVNQLHKFCFNHSLDIQGKPRSLNRTSYSMEPVSLHLKPVAPCGKHNFSNTSIFQYNLFIVSKVKKKNRISKISPFYINFMCLHLLINYCCLSNKKATKFWEKIHRLVLQRFQFK